ncbi:hypothetical protein THAOC_16607 [Thalassiosira oceanica]|uniref:Uncharacterized protein n=1 Tax=Thalassiosira oceanica TaxID=159749 RepID=K0S9H4_THAOC|nr:hypothetical protein THAOC_16607 [Thalassiosira oceanica]|eukprot:EJK62768.1 hypothetical protein THAOC_16607 [Thalassiosira oceanica]
MWTVAAPRVSSILMSVAVRRRAVAVTSDGNPLTRRRGLPGLVVNSSGIPRNSFAFLPLGFQRNGIGVFVPRNAKRNAKEDSVSYQIIRNCQQGTKQSNTPSAGGSRIRKELKPADGAGEYVQEKRRSSVTSWNLYGRVAIDRPAWPNTAATATYATDWSPDLRSPPTSLVDTVKVVDMGEPKLSWPDWNPGHRSSISPRPPPRALIEYPVQAGRQQPLPHPGEGGGLTRRARPLSTVSLASPSPHAAGGSQRLFR